MSIKSHEVCAAACAYTRYRLALYRAIGNVFVTHVVLFGESWQTGFNLIENCWGICGCSWNGYMTHIVSQCLARVTGRASASCGGVEVAVVDSQSTNSVSGRWASYVHPLSRAAGTARRAHSVCGWWAPGWCLVIRCANSAQRTTCVGVASARCAQLLWR